MQIPHAMQIPYVYSRSMKFTHHLDVLQLFGCICRCRSTMPAIHIKCSVSDAFVARFVVLYATFSHQFHHE